MKKKAEILETSTAAFSAERYGRTKQAGRVARILAAAAFWTAIWLSTAFPEEPGQRSSGLRRVGTCREADSLVLLERPNDADALTSRGLCRMRSPTMRYGAIVDFKKALATEPCNIKACSGLVETLLNLKSAGEAQEVLERCVTACKKDVEASRRLASECWSLGFYRIARRLDRDAPPERGRELIRYRHTVTPEYTFSLLRNSDTRHLASFMYEYLHRPDMTLTGFGVFYSFPDANDALGGAAFVYRWTRELSFEYETVYSDPEGFMAMQKHRPKAVFSMVPGTIISLGADLSGYESGWVRMTRVQAEQRLRSRFLMRFSVSGGVDAMDKWISAHSMAAAWYKEKRFYAGLGYAEGHESVERLARIYTSDIVQSLFFNGKLFLRPTFGLQVSFINEWRERTYFRTYVSMAPVFSF
ncbi:hypothetical protein ACFL5V_10955 [Fibrobacterota bacterium]